jgi:hypothetical protein
MLRYATLHYATLRYSTLLYATLRYSTLLYATLRYSMLLYSKNLKNKKQKTIIFGNGFFLDFLHAVSTIVSTVQLNVVRFGKLFL